MPLYDTKYRSSLVFCGGSKPPPYDSILHNRVILSKRTQ